MLDLVILGNSLQRWLFALLVAAAVLGAVTIWRRVVARRLEPLVRTNTLLDDIVPVLAETTSGTISVLLAAYAGSLVLSLEPGVQQAARAVAVVLFLVQIGIWGSALIRRAVERYSERNRENNAAAAGTARLLGVVARIVLYSLVLLLILDNIPGVEVTALVASLGIGGIAVALAAQNILGDLFASLSIAFDKPFVVGDFIAVGEDQGTVELIGLKTTRLRSLSGEQLSFPNSDLVGSRIRNFARMEERRVLFTFRVPYDTSSEQLAQVAPLVQAIVEREELTRFDRAALLRFDDLGLVFEVVYFVLTPSFNQFAAIQQRILLALLDGLAERGMSVAQLADAGPRGTARSAIAARRAGGEIGREAG
jgi:small-conductance mechanosensitive channel